MNLPPPRLPAALTAAVQRIKVTAREAAQRCVDSLGVAVLNSVSNSEREHLLAAQFDLSRKLTMFATTFNERLDDSLATDFRRREGSLRTTSTGGSSWQSLTLVDDREVEIQVSADRFALTLEHDCEWELRELDALMIGLLHSPHAGRDAGERATRCAPKSSARPWWPPAMRSASGHRYARSWPSTFRACSPVRWPPCTPRSSPT